MYRPSRMTIALALLLGGVGLSVAQTASDIDAVKAAGALARPAGTEDADMRKEKLFPVGGGAGLHALPSRHARSPLSRWHGRLARGRRWTTPAASKSISPGAMQSRLFASGVRVSNRMEWN